MFKLFLCLLCSIPVLGFAGKVDPETKQELATFMQQYVTATNSHNFANVQPLLQPDAVYWFNKKESRGLPEIEASFNESWNYLPDEVYGIEDITWLSIDKRIATCIYTYTYQGTHNGKSIQGKGRGTTILVKENGNWKIAHEHLSIPQ
ncbi:YybH family protein [Pontibacter burrus]|uniref:Nuclear transport factor 2 family protein n=1 Tax=Pontibacter burrus TaxID=2704466 RepID=A0A6B3LNE9_9BACT|nr:nuclear transport factor 2 family protein [Pontibacter burrus]NEM97423.1 nuclear transport factor 2 family protein [Pontibacter burrus]